MSEKTKSNGHSKVCNEVCEEIIKVGRVIIFGLGNVGCRSAMELALLPGIKHIILVDDDKIELRNLKCSPLIGREDVGQYKVDVVAKLICRRFPEIEVVPIREPIASIGLARFGDFHPSIAIGALDSRLARYELSRVAKLLCWPLVDTGIPGYANANAARVQVTWNRVNGIDPLNAWSAKDWAIIDRRVPCSPKVDSPHQRKRPIASPVSGALASTLAASQVEMLLDGDTINIGFEIRVDLIRNVFRRSALPDSGLSPLSGVQTIDRPPHKCHAGTLSDLVNEAEAVIGQDARLLLNRSISDRFYCPTCGQIESKAGPADEGMNCSSCDKSLVAASPVQVLSKKTLGSLANERASVLGLNRDIIGLISSSGSQKRWLEYKYEEESNEKR